MRKIKSILLALAILMVTQAKAQTNDTIQANKWDRVMNAIIAVESKGNPKARNKKGDCAGILQITPILVKEANQILKRRKSTKRYTLKDRYNAEKSKEMFVLLQEHFNPEMNIEKVIKQWNCGFYGKWKNKSNAYYKKVLKYY